MDDMLTDELYVIRALGLIEPFAEKLRDADYRDAGEPLPNYEPFVQELETHSGRVEAIAQTYPDSSYTDELSDIANELEQLPTVYPARPGHVEQLDLIADTLASLATNSDAAPSAFDDPLDQLEELILVLETLHKAYEHLAETTELQFRSR